MKIANQILEANFPNSFTPDKVKSALTDKIYDLGYEEIIFVKDVEMVIGNGIIVEFGTPDGEEMIVKFITGHDGSNGMNYAVVFGDLEDDEENDEPEDRFVYLPLEIGLIQANQYADYHFLDMMNLDWLTDELFIRLIEEEDDDFDDDDFDESGDIVEAFTYVIRGGKKIKKKLVRQKRRKRMTAKQKQGARKGARKRKAMKGAINRKRKKSLKIRGRKNLKRNTNKRMKVAGTSSRKKR